MASCAGHFSSVNFPSTSSIASVVTDFLEFLSDCFALPLNASTVIGSELLSPFHKGLLS